MNQINPIQLPASFPQPTKGPAAGNETQSFKNMLIDGLKEVNQMQLDADKAVEQLATGGDVNPAEVLTMVQKTDMTFRMMMQIRNKMVQAYQELKEIRI